ncbi:MULTISPECIES: FAD-binding oxidoreductase [unclassified Iodidimonas]|jgi:FAD/FMN-containing dehydrogenase|uniref:FAD-binding oxidoreductase n=1 Tax=unclassified Iodidimonas TaxID=2626145 RepID=UPI0024822397|nr:MULTISPECIES: FAD-binding oxidoreductase [unclassified Iodidimonas]
MTLQHDHLAALKAALDPGDWSEDADLIAPHLVDWRDRYHGRTALFLQPDSTEKVAHILRWANRHEVALIVQGGNSGLVGGGIPDQSGSQVLLSLKRLNSIRDAGSDGHAIIAEAGVTLAAVQQAAAEQDRLFPLSLASEGSATIGGLVSTNAGGVHVLRYGTMRSLILGVEAVLPTGEIVQGLGRLHKDNTGYDLKSLLCGAEGTLGVITAASLRLYPAIKSRMVAMCALPTMAAAMALLARLDAESGERLMAFELIPRFGLDLVCRHLPDCRDPFTKPHDWYVLAEWASSARDEPLGPLAERLLAGALEGGLIHDAVLAASEGQATDLWRLRHHLSEAQKAEGASIKHDISLPQARIPEFIDACSHRLAALVPGIRPCIFGHLGDGNLHFNLSQPKGADPQSFLDRWDEISTLVHQMTIKAGGSISAEHGIGQMKAGLLAAVKDRASLQAMAAIKAALDPKGILNPGRILTPAS